MIKLLLDLQPKWHWHLAVIHCDHRWRSDSAANADHVAALAEFWQIPCYQEIADPVPASEAAAREWRYQVFSDIAQQQQYSHVVTGHTASDRAETLLYNLMRGSGADGLQALGWMRSLAIGVQLVRPLLAVTRTETGRFCQEFQLPVWEDSTNQNTAYARNRIRQELLPYLQNQFNPQVETALAQTAEILTAEVTYLEQQAEVLYHQAKWQGKGESGTIAGIDRHLLRAAPLALQRRAVRRMLQSALPEEPGFDHIEKLIALVSAPNRSQTDPFPGGTIARVDNRWIVLTTD